MKTLAIRSGSAALLVALLATGISCNSEEQPIQIEGCETDRDCPEGEMCQNGACKWAVSPPDAGPTGDGTPWPDTRPPSRDVEAPDVPEDVGEPAKYPCCLAEGCEMRTLKNCRADGGEVDRRFDSCASRPTCPTTVVACCTDGKGDERCHDWPRRKCLKRGGTIERNRTCADDPCGPPRGACCTRRGRCEVVTAKTCRAKGGRFEGKGRDCASTTCHTDKFACCREAGCTMEGMPQCKASGGTPMPGKTCRSNPCSKKGACCKPAGCSMTTQKKCRKAGGVYRAGMKCSAAPCTGVGFACCNGGRCSNRYPAQCNGVVHRGEQCSDDPCAQVVPCCGLQPSCIEVDATVCKTNGGVVKKQATCSQVVCGRCSGGSCSKKGACCAHGSCRDDIGKMVCRRFRGRYYPLKSCSQVDCSSPPTGPSGACCEWSPRSQSVTCSLKKKSSRCGGGFLRGAKCSQSICDSKTLGGPKGVCCGTRKCVNLRKNYCPKSTTFKKGYRCANNPCATTGACCASGVCQDGAKKQTCRSLGGTFHKGKSCGQVNCP